MNNSKKEYVHKLLYSENKKDTIDEIKSITDSELLHIIAGNYNWDNGFEIPYNIINNDKQILWNIIIIGALAYLGNTFVKKSHCMVQ
ncbi:DUF4274 domain-containing protein [Megasphaera sp.]|uniref:DUF4274 domain-containing protein n=1 Tax=Megasphaera sp. TaxID=2023260 RepID=UPI003AB77A31